MIKSYFTFRGSPSGQAARKMLRSFDTIHFRRHLLICLGGRQRFRARTKLLFSLLIFSVSFSIKSLVAVDLSPLMYTTAQPAGGMAQEYSREAVSIATGKGILFPDEWDPADTSLLVHAPGYSICLAGIYSSLDDSYFTVQFVQNAVNSFSPVLIFLIAGNLLTWPVGVISGLLAAISHHLSYYSNFILPDSLCALPILLAIYILVLTEHSRCRPWGIYALVGGLIGLSVWLRPNALMLGLFVAIFYPLISIRRRQTARRAWVVAVVTFLIVAPITIRNYVIFGELVPVSINTGIVLWEGIADAGGERFGAVRSDGEVIAQEALLYGNRQYGESWAWPDGIKRDRDRIRRSLNVIMHNPIWFAGAMVWRMGQMFKYSAQAPLVFRSIDTSFVEAGKLAKAEKRRRLEEEFDAESNISARERSRRLSLAYGESISWTRLPARALQRLTKETMLLFIILGAPVVFFLSWRRGFYLGMVPIYYLLAQSTMHTEFRYTLPMQYFVFVFAATVWVWTGFFTRRMAKRLAALYRGIRKQDAA